MLAPLLSFILGFFWIVFTILSYRGTLPFNRSYLLAKIANNFLFLWGNISISLAAILGVIGFWNVVQSSDLRLVRIILLILGIAITSWSLKDLLDHDNSKNLDGLKGSNHLNLLTYILTGISILTVVSIFLVAFFDYNYGGDAFMYHVPFAARIWGIISPEQYTFEYATEHRYLGFPLLPQWFQGFFWSIFKRPEATNLTEFLSLILLIVYLKNYLKIPFYLAVLPLLAIPMVHMHASKSYVDLFGNAWISILILTLFLLYSNKKQLDKTAILIIFFGAAGAANSKHLLVPVVAFLLVFVAYQIFITYYIQIKDSNQRFLNLTKIVVIGSLAILLIFATNIKNTILYHNPFYPVEVSIMGHVLNHTEPQSNYMNEEIRRLSPPIRWFKSALEIDVFDSRRPWPWTIAMDFVPWDDAKYGMGGYFGGYFIFNIVIFSYLCWKHKKYETKVAIALVIIMTLMTWLLPQSYELRFYMYWMIVFVSLNSYLLYQYSNSNPSKLGIIRPQYFGLTAIVFMLIFIHKTDKFFTIPRFESLNHQLKEAGWIEPKIIQQFKEGDEICLVGKVPHTFLYNSFFHPPHNYSLKSEFLISEEWTKEQCKNRKIIR